MQVIGGVSVTRIISNVCCTFKREWETEILLLHTSNNNKVATIKKRDINFIKKRRRSQKEKDAAGKLC